MRPKQVMPYAAFGVFILIIAGCSNEPNEKGHPMNTLEIELTNANFDKETSTGVVLVDFWASWCSPCQIQGPIIEKVAVAMQGKAKVGKCNVDKSPQIAERFGIRSIPTLIILKDKQEVERLVGVQQEGELIATIEKHMK